MDTKQSQHLTKPGSLTDLRSRIENRHKNISSSVKSTLGNNQSTVFLLIDTSFSMQESTKLSQAKSGAYDFAVNAIKKGYMVGVIKFDSTAAIISNPSTDSDSLKKLIDHLSVGPYTNMGSAITLATEQLGQIYAKKIMVIVSDGMPCIPGAGNTAISDEEYFILGKKEALSAADAAKIRGIEIITIGTDDADMHFLDEIASRKEFAVFVDREQLSAGISKAAQMLPEKI